MRHIALLAGQAIVLLRYGERPAQDDPLLLIEQGVAHAFQLIKLAQVAFNGQAVDGHDHRADHAGLRTIDREAIHRASGQNHKIRPRLAIGGRIGIDSQNFRLGALPQALHQRGLLRAQIDIGRGRVVALEQIKIRHAILHHFQVGKQRADFLARQIARIGFLRLQIVAHGGVVSRGLHELRVFFHLRIHAGFVLIEHDVHIGLVALQDHDGVQQAGYEDDSRQRKSYHHYKAEELLMRYCIRVLFHRSKLTVTFRMSCSMPWARNSS